MFVSPKKKTFHVCHACDKQHEGGYMKCRNITDEMRGKVNKLVKAGVFDNKSGGVGDKPTTARSTGTRYKKRGAVNVVVEEEDDGKETEVEGGGLPSREYLLQMLGMSNILVGNVN